MLCVISEFGYLRKQGYFRPGLSFQILDLEKFSHDTSIVGSVGHLVRRTTVSVTVVMMSH